MNIKILLTTVLLLLTSYSYANDTEYDIVVDRNGRGQFRNIAQAFDSIRLMDNTKTIKVFIRDGFYKEKLDLTADISNVHFVGESRENTIINYDDHARIDEMGTFKTYTFRISGHDLVFENLTIENTALQLGQAVALHIQGDKVIFKNCKFLGNQDTIYAGDAGSRQYFVDCYIEGTTDFIFGPATAYFQNCAIYCKRASYITAPNTPQDVKYGFIFNNCTIKLQDDVAGIYLGRPWRPYGMTLFMNSELGAGVKPKGWDNWRNAENEKTARFMEYNNTGAGADTSGRVDWSTILTQEDAKEYTLEKVLSGNDNWNPINVLQN